VSKAVIFCGYRHTIESPRCHYPDAELWMQSTSIRNWDWSIYNWSRWFDIHTVGPQAHYPGIQMQRPDVFAWYTRQGNERPILLGARRTPRLWAASRIPERRWKPNFGAGRFGCQLDYMAALALSEGFDRWILYGMGQPYVSDPGLIQGAQVAQGALFVSLVDAPGAAAGVEIVFDGPNMFTPELYGNEPPREQPMTGAYGYDMRSDFEHYTRVQREGFALTR
jgi:hypothetical protein